MYAGQDWLAQAMRTHQGGYSSQHQQQHQYLPNKFVPSNQSSFPSTHQNDVPSFSRSRHTYGGISATPAEDTGRNNAAYSSSLSSSSSPSPRPRTSGTSMKYEDYLKSVASSSSIPQYHSSATELPNYNMPSFSNSYGTTEPQPTPSASTNDELSRKLFDLSNGVTKFNPLATFGDKPVSVLICGIPNSGKTSLLKHIFNFLSYRVDTAHVFTNTVQSIPWFEAGMPLQYIVPYLDMPRVQRIMNLQVQATKRGLNAETIVAFDDVLIDQAAKYDAKKNGLEAMVKTGHRNGIFFLTGVHSAGDVFGSSKDCYQVKMQCGLAKDLGKKLQEFWVQFAEPIFPDYEKFREFYESFITSKGHALVIENVGGRQKLSIWQPEEMKWPFVIGHDDWYIATRLWADPIRTFFMEEGKPKWFFVDNSPAQQLLDIPTMSTLTKQQKGEEVVSSATEAISFKVSSKSRKGNGSLENEKVLLVHPELLK